MPKLKFGSCCNRGRILSGEGTITVCFLFSEGHRLLLGMCQPDAARKFVGDIHPSVGAEFPADANGAVRGGDGAFGPKLDRPLASGLVGPVTLQSAVTGEAK
jgi:hypothetical protein